MNVFVDTNYTICIDPLSAKDDCNGFQSVLLAVYITVFGNEWVFKH